ncbi:protein of unknown function [Bradyrhizobium vignae]|uniref:Uncharacterized protein n=1 Tax=Bradyrhizobium vignae TaxID=1549949 RepID=A0A2U3PT44_9BRAD|nr:protein of unknown function [Bradyrhizobium vignae]
MAFLGLRTRIRAHGTTNSRILRCVCHRPFSFIRTLTVGFGVAPNLLTLPFGMTLTEGARGLGPFGPYRRWGLSPRPENIGRPGLSDLAGTMPPVGGSKQACSAAQNRMVPCCRGGAPPRTAELATGGFRESDSDLFSFVNNCGRDQLWTNESWLVDGLGTQLRRFRKSHQLIRDRPRRSEGDRESDSRDRRR